MFAVLQCFFFSRLINLKVNNSLFTAPVFQKLKCEIMDLFTRLSINKHGLIKRMGFTKLKRFLLTLLWGVINICRTVKTSLNRKSKMLIRWLKEGDIEESVSMRELSQRWYKYILQSMYAPRSLYCSSLPCFVKHLA